MWGITFEEFTRNAAEMQGHGLGFLGRKSGSPSKLQGLGGGMIWGWGVP